MHDIADRSFVRREYRMEYTRSELSLLKKASAVSQYKVNPIAVAVFALATIIVPIEIFIRQVDSIYAYGFVFTYVACMLMGIHFMFFRTRALQLIQKLRETK